MGTLHGVPDSGKQVGQRILLLIVGDELTGLVPHLLSTGHDDREIRVVMNPGSRSPLKDKSAIKQTAVALRGFFQTMNEVSQLFGHELIPNPPVLEAFFPFGRGMTQLMKILRQPDPLGQIVSRSRSPSDAI